VNWADECDFGYDNIPDLSLKYKDELERKQIGHIEGLMYIALQEAKKDDSKLYKKWIDITYKAVFASSDDSSPIQADSSC
jgi:hypothetical protein